MWNVTVSLGTRVLLRPSNAHEHRLKTRPAFYEEFLKVQYKTSKLQIVCNASQEAHDVSVRVVSDDVEDALC